MAEGAMTSAVQRAEVSYPPSWIDRLIDWIDELPLPTWLAYLLFAALVVFLLNAMFWPDGSLAVGAFNGYVSSFAPWTVYWLAAYHYLSRVGSRALREFSPLLDGGEKEIARLDQELSTLPAWLGWLSIPLGLLLSALSILGEPNPYYGGIELRSPLPVIGDIVFTGFMLATFLPLVIRSVRQLRMVTRLHRRAHNIDLLELGPAHAFAALTARTGAALVLVLILGTLQDQSTDQSAVDLLLTIGVILVALAVFVVPLVDMRSKLEEARDAALSEVNELLRLAGDRLRGKVRNSDYGEMAGTKEAFDALMSERARLEKLSTWPWDSRTVRGFASTLVLPIVLWIATRLLEELF